MHGQKNIKKNEAVNVGRYCRDCASVFQPFIVRRPFPALSLIYLFAPSPPRLFEDLRVEK
jgi:hypothetical protein